MAIHTTSILTSEKRQQLFKRLYLQVFPKVAALVSRQGGLFTDAQDIFQDALVIFYQKTCDHGFVPKINEDAYLLGIARHLWNNKRKLPAASSLSDFDVPDAAEHSIDQGSVLQLIERTGKKCLQLLHAFYYEGLAPEQLTKMFGFGSVRSATVQKYKCLEKVRDTVKQKSMVYADFVD